MLLHPATAVLHSMYPGSYPVVFPIAVVLLRSFLLSEAYLEVWETAQFYVTLAPSPTPNLEGQGIPFCLGYDLRPVWHGRPYKLQCYRQHSCRDHLTTQAPPLRQSRDAFRQTYILKS